MRKGGKKAGEGYKTWVNQSPGGTARVFRTRKEAKLSGYSPSKEMAADEWLQHVEEQSPEGADAAELDDEPKGQAVIRKNIMHDFEELSE